MRTDTPQGIQGALGIIEDEMALMLPEWADAAGDEADFAIWERMQYLRVKEEFVQAKRWPKGTTETTIKDDIQLALHERFSDEYDAHRHTARQKARGDALFKGLDARRSIGQTLLKPHLQDEPRYGQGAYGQAGVGA